jgi:DNA-directed RNA polymerase specialized sigma24 family protein
MATYHPTRTKSPRATLNLRRGPSVRATNSSYIPLLRALARTRTPHDAEADDLVADTLLEAVIHIGELAPRTNRKAWLLALQRGVFNATGRAQPAPPERPPGNGPGPQRQRLREALVQLPDALREPVFLFDGVGCSVREVAEILGCTVSTAEARIIKARSRLRELVDAQAAPPNGNG